MRGRNNQDLRRGGGGGGEQVEISQRSSHGHFVSVYGLSVYCNEHTMMLGVTLR